MTREEAISIINGLYPADAPYEDTAKLGEQLLERAKREVPGGFTWRDEPTAVLIRYAELCELKERDQARNINRSLSGW